MSVIGAACPLLSAFAARALFGPPIAPGRKMLPAFAPKKPKSAQNENETVHSIADKVHQI